MSTGWQIGGISPDSLGEIRFAIFDDFDLWIFRLGQMTVVGLFADLSFAVFAGHGFRVLVVSLLSWGTEIFGI